MRLANRSIVELQEIVRKDPQGRVAAWTELTYRNRWRLEIEVLNPPPALKDGLEAKPWVPPDLSVPEPMKD